jgi:protein SCO1/2
MEQSTVTSNRTDSRFILLAVLVALLSAAAGFSLWQLRHEGPPEMTASLRILPEPRVLADFDLVDQDGAQFTLRQLQGKWSLLFFGFTHCPDVCPSALYDLHQVNQAVTDSDADEASYQFIFVSVDPERDSPQRLRDYVAYFDPEFRAATGSPEQLAALARQIGVAYRIEPHEPGSERYLVDHSASIMLTDPEGRLHGVFPAPHDAGHIAQDLAAILD